MSAYSELYLDWAMKNLGEAFDYAVNCCGRDIDLFSKLFIASKLADLFGKGNPKYIVGISGTELAVMVFELTGESMDFPDASIDYDYSPEYWAGWSIAYYQWKSGKSFKNIFSYISMTEILKLYPTLHEASEEKFVDVVDSIIERRSCVTRLQLQRKLYGCSQRELAEKTGVNLRTLQQYELGTKDIRKASVSTVLALANELGCSVDDIM